MRTLRRAASVGLPVLVIAALVARGDTVPSGDVSPNPIPLNGIIGPSDGHLNVGAQSVGELRIDQGSTVIVTAEFSFVANAGGSSGRLTVKDPGSLLDCTTPLHVGNGGVFTPLEDGFEYGLPNQPAIGYLDVLSGGEVRASSLLIGNENGPRPGDLANGIGIGSVRVEDPGSLLAIAGRVTGGARGSSALRVANGGVARAESGTFAFEPSSTSFIEVDGPGSRLEFDGFFFPIFGGAGTLDITNGGVVVNRGFAHVGAEIGSQGDIRVDGAGSRWEVGGGTGGALVVGVPGAATLEVTNGAELEVNAWVELDPTIFTLPLLVIGAGLAGSGEMQVRSGGQVRLVDVPGTTGVPEIDVGGNGTFNPGGAGRLLIEGVGSALHMESDDGAFANVGRNGVGVLELFDGALFEARGDAGLVSLYIGAEGGTGVATVQRSTLVLETGDPERSDGNAFLSIGSDASTGRLDILNGATVRATSARVGGDAGSGRLRVAGADATLSLGDAVRPGHLVLGDGGTAEAEVFGGARVEATFLNVGFNGGNARLLVNGTLALTDFSDQEGSYFAVGAGGTGVLDVWPDGVLTSRFGDIGLGGGVGEMRVDGEVALAGGPTGEDSFLAIGNAARGLLTVGPSGQLLGHHINVGAGANGDGALEIEGGAATLAGVDSLGTSALLWVGADSARGALSVRGGGELTIDSAGATPDRAPGIALGQFPASSGGAVIQDGGTIVRVTSDLGHGFVTVGHDGEGAMHVFGGARVEAGNVLQVARNAGSTGAVDIDGAGTAVVVTDVNGASGAGPVVLIGRGGEGVVNVRAGGRLSIEPAAATSSATGAPGIFIGGTGASAGGRGELNVQGPGSIARIEGGGARLIVGRNGTGALSVLSGGRVEVENPDGDGRTFVGFQVGTSGEVLVAGNGSLLDAGAFLGIAASPGTIGEGGNAFVRVLAPGVIEADLAHIGRNGRLDGTGTLRADAVVFGGVVTPGAPTGTLTIDGDLSTVGGGARFEIEIGGDAAFDAIDVTGAATFGGGTFQVRFVEGFAPELGDRWTFLEAAGGIFDFARATVSVSPLAAGLAARVEVTATTATLEIVDASAGGGTTGGTTGGGTTGGTTGGGSGGTTGGGTTGGTTSGAETGGSRRGGLSGGGCCAAGAGSPAGAAWAIALALGLASRRRRR